MHRDAIAPNAFGALRLLLASLVIAGHTPDLIDGTRHRELLFRLTGTLSFGDLAVNGFFILSGFLIAASLVRSQTIDYLTKRVFRIYPAFVVCSLVLVFLLGPMVGGVLTPGSAARSVMKALTLGGPNLEGVFDGLHYAHLNGAAWTIKFEFFCYLLIIPLHRFGLMRSPWMLAGISGAMLLAHVVLTGGGYAPVAGIPQHLTDLLRLGGLFLVGSALFARRDPCRFDPRGIWLAAAGLLACLMTPATMTIGCALFGSYMLLGTAFAAGSTPLRRVNSQSDISYGLYLYAWPVEMLLIWLVPGIGLLAAGSMTWLLAALLGWISWVIVEKPAQALGHRIVKARKARMGGDEPMADALFPGGLAGSADATTAA